MPHLTGLEGIDMCRQQSKLLASLVRVKGSKGGSAPARQSSAIDSGKAGQKRPRTEDVPSQAPAQPSAALLNGKEQEQPSNTKQEESGGEPGLAGLLGRHFRAEYNSGIFHQYNEATAGCCTCSDILTCHVIWLLQV